MTCDLDTVFAPLIDQVGDEQIGECLEDASALATGDVRQRTTRGVLVWYQRDGSSTFTDGIRTWTAGPDGVEERPNASRVAAERPSIFQFPATATVAPVGAPSPVAQAVAPVAQPASPVARVASPVARVASPAPEAVAPAPAPAAVSTIPVTIRVVIPGSPTTSAEPPSDPSEAVAGPAEPPAAPEPPSDEEAAPVARPAAPAPVSSPRTSIEGTLARPAPPVPAASPQAPQAVDAPPAAPTPAAAPAAVAPPPVAHAPASVDPVFEPAIDAIRSLNEIEPDPPLGDVYLSLIERPGVRIVVGPLAAGVNARYTPVGDTIVVSPRLLDEDPRTIAAVLVHELTHVGQVRILGEWGGRDCVHMEVEAFRTQSVVWAAFWDDHPPRGTRLERELTMIGQVVAENGEPGLYKLVVDTPDYQKNCDVWVPGSSGSSGPARAQPATIGWPVSGGPPSGPPPTATPIPIPAALPTPGSRLTSRLAARCYTLASDIKGDAAAAASASPTTGTSASRIVDTLNVVNTQCRDIADKYGDSGVDCYEPAARDFWRNGATLLADRSESGEVANTVFIGRVATCLKTLAS
jgi:hypothetical protein